MISENDHDHENSVLPVKTSYKLSIIFTSCYNENSIKILRHVRAVIDPNLSQFIHLILEYLFITSLKNPFQDKSVSC